MNGNFKMLIANKIDNFISDKKMTNEDFGKVFGVAEWVVRRWRSGATQLNPDQLARLCQYWEIDFNNLFNNDYSTNYSSSVLSLSDLIPAEVEVIELYRSNDDFKKLVDNATKLAKNK